MYRDDQRNYIFRIYLEFIFPHFHNNIYNFMIMMRMPVKFTRRLLYRVLKFLQLIVIFGSHAYAILHIATQMMTEMTIAQYCIYSA